MILVRKNNCDKVVVWWVRTASAANFFYASYVYVDGDVLSSSVAAECNVIPFVVV